MKWIKLVSVLCMGIMVGKSLQKYSGKAHENQILGYGEKWFEYFQLLNRWLTVKSEGKRIADFFDQEEIGRVAVYGVGDLANRLSEELRDTRVELLYGIDRDVSCTNSKVEVIYSLDDEWPEVDAIVITPFLSVGEIEKALRQKCSCRLIPLDEILYSM